MAILRRLYNQGNSVVVSIPPYMLDQLNLKPGDLLALSILKPADPKHGESIEARPFTQTATPKLYKWP